MTTPDQKRTDFPCGNLEREAWLRRGANPVAIVEEEIERWVNGEFAGLSTDHRQAVGHALVEAMLHDPQTITPAEALHLSEA